MQQPEIGYVLQNRLVLIEHICENGVRKLHQQPPFHHEIDPIFPAFGAGHRTLHSNCGDGSDSTQHHVLEFAQWEQRCRLAER